MASPQKELAALGFGPLKKLGQNFLVNKSSAQKIYDFAEVPNGMPVLEIGPGLGAMSEVIAEHAHPLQLVEKDSRVVPYLRDKIVSPTAKIDESDFLKWEWPTDFGSAEKQIYVLSNLPYSVSTPIIEVLFQHLPKISGLTLLMQKEMVDRICAKPGIKNYGRLSIWAQCMCECIEGPIVSPGSFYPVPNVDSRLLKMVPRKKPLVSFEQQKDFFSFITKLFVKRRKMIRSILSDDLKASTKDTQPIEAFFTLRPEVLTIEQLFTLYSFFF